MFVSVYVILLCRFGSFEIVKKRDVETGRVGPSVGRDDILHQLLDFVTQSYYPKVLAVYVCIFTHNVYM